MLQEKKNFRTMKTFLTVGHYFHVFPEIQFFLAAYLQSDTRPNVEQELHFMFRFFNCIDFNLAIFPNLILVIVFCTKIAKLIVQFSI